MGFFEQPPAANPQTGNQERKSESGEPQDMSRRRFLRTAGAVTAGAALSMLSPESLAQQSSKEKRVDFVGFQLSEFQKKIVLEQLEKTSPKSTAEFVLRGPNLVAGERLIVIHVTIRQQNGQVIRGQATGFYNLTPVDQLVSDALQDAFETQ